MKIITPEVNLPCEERIKNSAGSEVPPGSPMIAPSQEGVSPTDQLGAQLTQIRIVQRSARQAQLIEQLPSQPAPESDAPDQGHATEEGALALPSTTSPVTLQGLLEEVLVQMPGHMPLGSRELINFSLTNKILYAAAEVMRDKSSAAYAVSLIETEKKYQHDF